jgi:hypothetical protein
VSHTPGPWEMQTGTRGPVITGVKNDDTMVVATLSAGLSAPANARLIAAAPELLAALKQIAEEAIKHYPVEKTSYEAKLLSLGFIAGTCARLIAKAEGRGE